MSYQNYRSTDLQSNMSNETDFNKVAQTVAQNVQQISNNGNVVIVVAIGLLI